MLDKRLTAVAALCRAGARLADIGTDHAYLPVALVSGGLCPGAVAADIAQGPAAAARAHIAAAGLTDRIEVRVGDGLRVMAPEEAEDIVIAGMGGETIVQILADAPWVRRADIRLILQPMTKVAALHGWLLQNGFAISEETLTRDGRHDYLAMAASYAAAPPSDDLLAAVVGGLSAAAGMPYFVRQLSHLRRRAAHGDEQAAALADRLQEYMEGKDSQ